MSNFHPPEINFHPLEVVGRGSETQLQVGENFNCLFSGITVTGYQAYHVPHGSKSEL